MSEGLISLKFRFIAHLQTLINNLATLFFSNNLNHEDFVNADRAISGILMANLRIKELYKRNKKLNDAIRIENKLLDKLASNFSSMYKLWKSNKNAKNIHKNIKFIKTIFEQLKSTSEDTNIWILNEIKQ